MKRIIRPFTDCLLRDDEGASMAEYGLLLVLVSIAAITALGLLGTTLEGIFNDVVVALGGTP